MVPTKEKKVTHHEGPPPRTPDGRYLVVRGRLWRLANPHLPEAERDRLVRELMAARRAVRDALDAEALRAARAAVDGAKRALGERGPPWWTDGAPDHNRKLARNTPYRDWWAALEASGSAPPLLDASQNRDKRLD